MTFGSLQHLSSPWAKALLIAVFLLLTSGCVVDARRPLAAWKDRHLINQGGIMKRQFFIAGVQFRPREDTGKACKFLQAGDYLFLKREPSNKFDPNAVQILVRQELISHDVADAEGVFLGYVPKKFSSEISAMMEIGASLNCVIDEVNSSAKTYEMFKVTVSIPVDEPIIEDDATYEQHLEEEKR